MTGRAHLRPVGTTAAPQPEPIAEERIEWGHLLVREQIVWPCADALSNAPRTAPCQDPTVDGVIMRHVSRRVITTEWQEPPHAD